MSKTKYLPAGEVATFCGQVSLILKAGIPLYDGMDTLCESCQDEKAKRAFGKISDVLSETGSLHKAVQSVGFFPEYFVNMVLIGEESGKLDDVLASLEKYYEREDKVRKSIKSAITYPILIIIMMTAVVTLLITKVMPIFENIFSNLGADISASGKAIMNVGTIVGKVAFVITLVLVLAILGVYAAAKLGAGEKLKEFSYKLPGIRGLNKKISAGRFASVLSMMIGSGYSLEKALEMAPGIVQDKMAKEKIIKCGELLNEGKSFPDALNEIKMFDGLQNRMISVGYKAGQMDSVMAKMADIYEEEVDESLGKMVSFIEPTLVAILSIIIGGILVSVLLPLASIMSSIG